MLAVSLYDYMDDFVVLFRYSDRHNQEVATHLTSELSEEFSGNYTDKVIRSKNI